MKAITTQNNRKNYESKKYLIDPKAYGTYFFDTFIVTVPLKKVLSEQTLKKYNLENDSTLEVAIEAMVSEEIELHFWYRLEGYNSRVRAFMTKIPYNADPTTAIKDAIPNLLGLIDWEYAVQITLS